MVLAWERLRADEIEVGDEIARAKTHDVQTVAEIGGGPVSVRFVNAAGQTIMRPRRTAWLWRYLGVGADRKEARLMSERA